MRYHDCYVFIDAGKLRTRPPLSSPGLICVCVWLDLLVYESGSLAIRRFVKITEKNKYFQMIRGTWGEQLKHIFEGIDDPAWNAPDPAQPVALSLAGDRSYPVRMPPPEELRVAGREDAPLQSVAQENGGGQH